MPYPRARLTAEDEALFRDLYANDVDRLTIARRFQKSRNWVTVTARRLGLPSRRRGPDVLPRPTRGVVKAPPRDAAVPLTQRKCLRCGKPFGSEGAHHRLCDSCKSGNTWRFALGAAGDCGYRVAARRGV